MGIQLPHGKRHSSPQFRTLRAQALPAVLSYALHLLYGKFPDYLSNIVTREACRPQSFTSGLRSSSTTNFAIPQLRTKCGERAFSHAGPAAWNALPEDMRAVYDSVVYTNRLKTHRLVLRFNVF